jgi:hypothetical protein
MSAHLIHPRRASDPSPGPRRLVKAPVAVHPLPLGEGKNPIPSLSPRERGGFMGLVASLHALEPEPLGPRTVCALQWSGAFG